MRWLALLLLCACNSGGQAPPSQADDAAADSPADGPPKPEPAPHELRAAAERVLPGMGSWEVQVSPPFPNRWPQPTALLYFAYRIEPAPTGEELYLLNSPHQVALVAPDALGSPVATALDSRPLGLFKPSPPRGPHQEGIHALIRTVTGNAVPSDQQYIRDGYRAWCNANRLFCDSAPEQIAAFINSLELEPTAPNVPSQQSP